MTGAAKMILAILSIMMINMPVVSCFIPTLHHSITYRRQQDVHYAKRSTLESKSKRGSTFGRKKGKIKQKMERQDLNDLVKSMGLNPVEQVTTFKQQEKKKSPSSSLSSQDLKEQERQDKPSSKVPLKTQLQYARNGHAVLRSKISPSTIATLREDLLPYSQSKELGAWQQKVQAATDGKLSNDEISKKYRTVAQCQELLKHHDGDDITIPFLQHFNTWRDVPSVREFVTSKHLTSMARALLDVPTIKLYQDSLFHKRSNDGHTPWHSDARMAPFDTSNMITFWIPLQEIASEEEGGSGLLFVDKSHCDFALPFWNRVPRGDIGDGDDYDSETGRVKYEESQEYERLDERYRYSDINDGVHHYMPMMVGDCTVHAGWTLHSANSGVNKKFSHDRYALAVTFVDAKAEIREDAAMSGSLGHGEDRKSYEGWISDVEPRTYFEHPLVPIV